ncbi:MAG: NADH-quinone oxidoreductase subunit L [Elusimicrobiaceae bacterium]|nr:NADH-quinone oxidoreductase subunit L [Elusimicrobiaceae bacterium]MBT3955033.1 NADH-quinone oxidoreductase subunit L [Elusimicrobiaceae bacterium]MBT4008075.1 NADH-quinone oxidoreductase subunit L [Elusimicrobiaceae bacterium]MBT4402729.1 NADH-quinone oxidoreductase subunit L [Elusimicrobiaceae bacterium]MBT4439987.1 NADH-quinone oxidoreductase subunit L [Elusimicrobiaceae bacterium]
MYYFPSLLYPILLPILGSLFIAYNKKLSIRPSVVAVIIAALVFVSNIYFISFTNHGISPEIFLPMSLGFNFFMQADLMSVFMALTSSFLSLIILIYCLGYIKKDEYETEFYSMAILFLGAMMGLVYSMNLMWLFIFWEITAIASWRLVGYFRADADTLKANKTFLITMGGALFLLLGIIIILLNFQTLDLNKLQGQAIPTLAVVFIIIGAFSKSAIFPFSTWLPDAGVAPSPVTAMLHAAVLVKIGVFAFAKIFHYIPLDVDMSTLVLYMTGISSLIAGGAALIETNIKRIIAYSTISQIGFIFLGFATYTQIGFVGGMLFILMHGISKAGLFLAAGTIEHTAHTKDISKMGNLFKAIPITGVAFGLCALSVMGIPPFGGFFSKMMVIKSAAGFGNPVIFTIFLLGALLTILYLTRLFYLVFFGSPTKSYKETEKGTSNWMVYSVLTLGVLSLISGLLVKFPLKFLINVF